MTPTQNLITTQARRLFPEVVELYERALKLEREHTAGLQRVAGGYHDSAATFCTTWPSGRFARQLQMAQAAIGLNSLGRMEAHTLSTLHLVLFALHRIANQDWKPAVRPPANLDTGQMLLARHAKALQTVRADRHLRLDQRHARVAG
jgi:pyruvate kinase